MSHGRTTIQGYFFPSCQTKTKHQVSFCMKNFVDPKTTKQTKKGYLKHVPSSPGSVKSGHMRRTQDFHAEENFAYCSKRKIAWLKAIPVYTVFMHQRCQNPYKYTSFCISARPNRCFSQPPSASFFDVLLSKKVPHDVHDVTRDFPFVNFHKG